MARSPNTEQITAALQQWPANQQITIEQLRPLADSGDEVARAVLAYLLGPQTGRWAEGLPYAKAAIEDGTGFLAYIYGQSLAGQPDAALRSEAAWFLRSALDDGWPVDSFSAVIQAASQGDPGAIPALLESPLNRALPLLGKGGNNSSLR
jgi:hypothetical protein